MSTWTEAAQAALEQYFERIRPDLVASGADPAEVIDDLRRHVQQEVATARLTVVTAKDVERLLARIGAPTPSDRGGGESLERNPAQEPAVTPGPVPATVRAGGGDGGSGMPDWSLPGPLASGALVAFGVVLPLVVLVVEWITTMCAATFFDPLPTVWHGLLVALVPAVNGFLWVSLKQRRMGYRRWLGWLAGGVIAVEIYYSLIFLPLLLPGLLAVIFYGFGLLPWSPVLSLVCTLFLVRRARLQLRHGGTPEGQGLAGVWAGWAIGMLLLVAFEAPEFVTRRGLVQAASEDPAEVRRGIELLRRWGDRQILLRECYGRTRGAAGMDLVAMLATGTRNASPEEARTAYYRVTGVPFNSVPAPRVRSGRGEWAGLNDWTWDNDQAGAQVGGRVKGLTLNASRLDAQVEANAGVAYQEWTLEFRNASSQQREARAQIVLPPGGVVSRLTLWVNGEEREAAFAGRSQVRQAYEQVVARRRDPVLVTTAGPDRVLMQCFPVPPEGGTMKVRLGITAPLEPLATNLARLRWPQMAERNFTVATSLRHEIWAEARRPLRTAGTALQVDQSKPGWQVVRGRLLESELADTRMALMVDRDPAVRESWTRDERGAVPGVVRQSLVKEAAVRPSRVVFVVDVSQGMAGAMPSIAQALEALPAGLEGRVVMAASEPAELTESLGSPALRERVGSWRAVGGEDNVPALLRAWDLAAGKSGAVVVWVHAAVPMLMESVEGLRQRWERQPGGPRLLDLPVRPGPNRVIEALDGLTMIEAVPVTGEVGADLRALLRSWGDGGERLSWRRERITPVPEIAPGPGVADATLHLARLWAHDEIVRLAGLRRREQAIDLAGRYQLVTPLSGAVVLENAQQYRDNNLEPASPTTVPAIPEPGILALLGGGLLLLVMQRRRRAAPPAFRNSAGQRE